MSIETRTESREKSRESKFVMLTSQWSTWRYWCVRQTTCPMPGLKYQYHVIGGRSVLELLLMVIIYGGLVAAGILGVADFAGDLAGYAALGMMFFTVRTNYILIHLFNISFERGLLYHKTLGLAVMSLVLINTINTRTHHSIAGIILCITMLGAPLVYLFEHIWGKFDLFYYPHITLTLVTIPAAFANESNILGIAMLMWVADMILRRFIRGKKVTAVARLVGMDVVNLQVPAPEAWEYGVGNYCFLMVPGINLIEYHPFSIASIPVTDNNSHTNSGKERVLSFYIKKTGDWTGQLHQFVQQQVMYATATKINEDKHNNQDIEMGDSRTSMPLVGVPITLFVEGPHGKLSVDVGNVDVYETIVLICGGVSITPVTTMLNELLRQRHPLQKNRKDQYKTDKEKESKMKHRKIYVIWSVRDPFLVEDVCQRIFFPLFAKSHLLPLGPSKQPAMTESNVSDEKQADDKNTSSDVQRPVLAGYVWQRSTNCKDYKKPLPSSTPHQTTNNNYNVSTTSLANSANEIVNSNKSDQLHVQDIENASSRKVIQPKPSPVSPAVPLHKVLPTTDACNTSINAKQTELDIESKVMTVGEEYDEEEVGDFVTESVHLAIYCAHDTASIMTGASSKLTNSDPKRSGNSPSKNNHIPNAFAEADDNVSVRHTSDKVSQKMPSTTNDNTTDIEAVSKSSEKKTKAVFTHECISYHRRPPLAKILPEIAQCARFKKRQCHRPHDTSDKLRIAVTVAGPSAMVRDVRNYCDTSILQGTQLVQSVTQCVSALTQLSAKEREEHVYFDCHEEIFRF